MHSASVTVDQKLISQIGRGILVFAAIGQQDTETEIDRMAAKVVKLKLWDDASGVKVRQLAYKANITCS